MTAGRLARALLAAGVVLVIFKLALSDGGRHVPSLTLAESVTYVLLAAAVAAGWIRRSWLVVSLLVMLAALALSAVGSVRPESTVREILLWTMYAGIALLTAAVLTPRWIPRAVDALVLVTGWLVLVALFMFWGSGDASQRWYATFYWPNPFAGFLLLAFPLTIVRALRASGPREALAQGAAGVLIGVALVYTYSRGAWLSAIAVAPIGLFVLGPVSWSRTVRRAALLAGGIAAAVILLAWAAPANPVEPARPLLVRAASIAGGGDPSVQGRLNFWRSALAIFADHPLIGAGAGTFGAVHAAYQRDVRFYARDAHNFYLQTAAETGIVGLLALAGLLTLIGLTWLRAMRRTQGTALHPLAVGIGLSVLALLLHTGMDMDWSFPAVPAMAFALVGVLMAMAHPRDEERPRRRARSRAPRGVAVVMLAAALGGAQAVRVADGYFVKGLEHARAARWDAAGAAYDGASRWNPLNPRYLGASAAAALYRSPARPAWAEAALRRAMRLDRMSATYPLQLASLLTASGSAGPVRFEEAEALIRRALAADPFNRPYAYRALATLYVQWGRPEQAEGVYTLAAARYLGQGVGPDSVMSVLLWPEIVGLVLEAADFKVQRGDRPAAIRMLQRVLAEDPDSEQIRTALRHLLR